MSKEIIDVCLKNNEQFEYEILSRSHFLCEELGGSGLARVREEMRFLCCSSAAVEEAVLEKLENLLKKEQKIIVFSSYLHIATKIYKRTNNSLKGNFFCITGAMKLEEREREIKKFLSQKDATVLFATDAVATGIKLGNVDAIFHLDIPSHAILSQRNNRINNLHDDVKIFFIVVKDTLQEKNFIEVEQNRREIF